MPRSIKKKTKFIVCRWNKMSNITNTHSSKNLDKLVLTKACQFTTFTYLEFHNVQVPTTSLTKAWSSISCGYIRGVSGTWATTTSIFNMNSSMGEPWNLSPPQWPLILPNTTFYIGFFGFTNTMDCPIFYYNPPNN